MSGASRSRSPGAAVTVETNRAQTAEAQFSPSALDMGSPGSSYSLNAAGKLKIPAKVTLTAALFTLTVTSPSAGMEIEIDVTQDGTGGRLMAVTDGVTTTHVFVTPQAGATCKVFVTSPDGVAVDAQGPAIMGFSEVFTAGTTVTIGSRYPGARRLRLGQCGGGGSGGGGPSPSSNINLQGGSGGGPGHWTFRDFDIGDNTQLALTVPAAATGGVAATAGAGAGSDGNYGGNVTWVGDGVAPAISTKGQGGFKGKGGAATVTATQVTTNPDGATSSNSAGPMTGGTCPTASSGNPGCVPLAGAAGGGGAGGSAGASLGGLAGTSGTQDARGLGGTQNASGTAAGQAGTDATAGTGAGGGGGGAGAYNGGTQGAGGTGAKGATGWGSIEVIG